MVKYICSMKVVCQQQKLNQALNQVSRLVPSRSELPILSNVLVEASSGNLSLYATNLQLSIAAQVPAEVEEEGRVTIPAAPVQGYVSSLPAQKIEMNLQDNRLQVKTADGSKTEASFVTMEAVDYPSFPEKGDEPVLSFQTQELARLIRKAAFAAAVEESRPVLTGVLVKVNDEEATFVSTDGFRLSEVRGSSVNELGEDQEMIIPASAFGEVEKLLGSAGEEEINIYYSQDHNQVIFDLVSVKLASRLLEAEYPDYEKILPEEFSLRATLNRSSLEQAVRTASIFAQRDGQTVYATLKDDQLLLEARSAEVGETHEELSAEVDGEELKIAFNAGFLREGLESLEGEEIIFEAKDSLSPTRWSSPSEDSYYHIIMPIRIEEE